MNRRIILLCAAALVVVGLAWAGRTIYRAKMNIVTIDVYNAPLADVIKKLERQTWETILARADLQTKVTLKVKNVPLDEALDQLGRQAGVNWSKWHAVYDSSRALNKLETALRNRSKIEDAGWTNLAPAGLETKLEASGVDPATIAPGAGRSFQTMAVDVQAPPQGANGDVMFKAGGPQPMIRMTTRGRDSSGKLVEEVWSPEHLVLEQQLIGRLGDRSYSDPSEAAAREVAKKTKADLTTLYVLSSAPGEFPSGGTIMRQMQAVGGAGEGTNGPAGKLPPLPDVGATIPRVEAENYVRLTPEQRVQRAREKQAAKANP